MAAQPWAPACPLSALKARAEMLRAVRAFFDARGVMEVQTAALAARGATDPAIASIATGDGRVLQTSPEHQMKRLLAAGAPSIYQVGPAFRAGEAGRWHNPEFTMLEWYRLGFDAPALMDEVAALVDVLLGAAPYERRTYASLVGVPAAQLDACADDALDLWVAEALAEMPAGRVFITDYPARQAALARVSGPVAARFELVVDGVEVANGYHELQDAAVLRQRMLRDNATRLERGLPEAPLDEALLAAHEHGLPDCAGVAVGLDRLLALQQGASSLAEVMPFPADRA